MIGPIVQLLRERWGDLRPGHPEPTDATIVVGANKVPDGKVSVVLFDANHDPAVVVKVARTAVGETALRQEFGVLQQFRGIGFSYVTDYAPEPLLLEEVNGRLILVLSHRLGRPMLTQYHTPGHTSNAERVAGDFAMAGDWLQAFHRQTLSGAEQLDAESFEYRVTAVFDRYRRSVGWSQEEEDLSVAVARRAAQLRGCPIPTTGVHGDFWMGNLLTENTRLTGVLDWELGLADGIPLSDLYKFPTSYGFYLDRAYSGSSDIPGHPDRLSHLTRWLRFGRWPNLVGFGYTYFGEGWFPELAQRFVVSHMAALGVPAAVNAVFFPVFLAEQAMTLDAPEFRQGYRSLLRALASERERTWLWSEESDHVGVRNGR
jgi:aminoglycoside phosphotransferase (APT) family kinase protein